MYLKSNVIPENFLFANREAASERKFIRDPVALPDRTVFAEVWNWVPDQFSFAGYAVEKKMFRNDVDI